VPCLAVVADVHGKCGTMQLYVAWQDGDGTPTALPLRKDDRSLSYDISDTAFVKAGFCISKSGSVNKHTLTEVVSPRKVFLRPISML
jgi:hypothetical protein